MDLTAMIVVGCLVKAVCPEGSTLRCNATAQRVVVQAEELDLNAVDLVTLAAIESGLDPSAVSEAGAVGVMQITPIAEAEVNQTNGAQYDRTRVRHNIAIAALYWQYLAREFDGHVPSMVAAYNAGPTRVMQYLSEGRPLPAETVNHVRKFKKLQRGCEASAWK